MGDPAQHVVLCQDHRLRSWIGTITPFDPEVMIIGVTRGSPAGPAGCCRARQHKERPIIPVNPERNISRTRFLPPVLLVGTRHQQSFGRSQNIGLSARLPARVDFRCHARSIPKRI